MLFLNRFIGLVGYVRCILITMAIMVM